MKKISYHRWNNSKSGVVSAKVIYGILSEAKQDFPVESGEKITKDDALKRLLQINLWFRTNFGDKTK